MRTITLPASMWQEHDGMFIEVVVKVNWPEVQLTDQQSFENAIARIAGRPLPHEDHSTFAVRLPRRPAN